MEGPFKEKLERGDTLIGTILSLPSPEIAEILSEIGFDWLFVDTEHGPLGPGSVQRILQAAGNMIQPHMFITILSRALMIPIITIFQKRFC